MSGATLINVEAEAALLGAMMIDNRIVDKVADRLRREDFGEPVMGLIFSAIATERSHGRDANPVTLRPHFVDCAPMQALGGPGFLAQLTGSGAVLIGWSGFTEQIATLAARRRLIEGLRETIELAEDFDRSPEELVAAADAAMTNATNPTGAVEQRTAGECGADVLNSIGQTLPGIVSGAIPTLDEAIGQLRPKQLLIGAGRPGMGKTAVAVSYSLAAAQRGHGVLFISLEISASELGERMLADVSFSAGERILYSKIRDRALDAAEQRHLWRAQAALTDMPLHVVDAGTMTMSRLNLLVRRYKRRLAARNQSLELVVIDYLQLIESDHRGRSNYETVSEVSRGLKRLAKDYDIAVFALAQLNRAVEQRVEKRPQMSDLRDSGQIEQDADSILLLYRNEYYLRQAEPDGDDAGHADWQTALDACANGIEFICAKRRNGEVATRYGRFHTQFQAVR